jgi:hypothetical protein
MADRLSPEAAAAKPSDSAAATLAEAWLGRLRQACEGETVSWILTDTFSATEIGAAVAELIERQLPLDRSLTIIVADDELPPTICNALDPSLRPLCLMLPAADFAVAIVLRSILSLLRNALGREADAGQASIWARQQQRVAMHAATWQQCLAWSDGDDGDAALPPAIAECFPVRIVAERRIDALADTRSDIALIFAPAAPRDVGARRVLHLLRQSGCPVPHLGDEPQWQAQLAVLSQELGHMEMELATVQAELSEFAARYQARVGVLMAQLDALQAEQDARPVAAHAQGAVPPGRFSSRGAGGSAGPQQRTAEQAPASAPFRSSSSLKRLYRQVAQRIHPDRATDEEDRARRTGFMVEANRAYRSADETALRDILARWQATGAQTASASIDVRRQLERVKARLGDIEHELHQIFASRLYEMFVAARLAQRRGRDLLEEMAADLRLRIAAAERRQQT